MSVLDLVEGRYWAAIAFLSGSDRDWLCGVFRDGDGPWVVSYRFRYYRDDKAHDSADERRTYRCQAEAPMAEEQAVARAQQIAHMLMSQGFADEQDWIFPKSADPETVFKMLATRPWAHVRKEAS